MTDEDKLTLQDFRTKLPLDRLELEQECCQQAIVYDEIGSWVAEVRGQAKTAKEHISFVESELSLKIRKKPADFDLPEDKKPTEGTIVATVIVHESYQKAVSDYIQADKLANEASTLLVSAEQRKSGLRDLVRLYVNNYYSQDDSGLDTSNWEQGEKAIQDARRRRQESQEEIKEDHREE